ncbi:MAG: diguanylate cyclase [Proteobacteria bacterium]|nr:diguanylate cyclase [Pseudomonadota bacterium]
MFTKNLLKSGWLHALFIAVIAYPAGVLCQKFIASSTQTNILVYTTWFMLSSAFALLMVSGPGGLATSTLKRFETWLYAILQIVVWVLELWGMYYISATQASGLHRTTGIFTLLLSVLFLNQKTNRYELLGCFIIISGAFIIFDNASTSANVTALLVFIFVVRSLAQGAQKIITEVHKTNRKAVHFKDQIRVTAFVMFVASFVFLSMLLTIAFVKSNYDIIYLKVFPNFADFADLRGLLVACGMGFFIVSVSKYCEFYAGKTIGAKYLTTIVSLQIVFVYFVEKALGHANVMEEMSLQSSGFIALALILIGNFVISLAGFIKDMKFIKKGEKQDTLANLDDNFIDLQRDFDLVKLNLINLLSLYDDNSKKLSEDINIDRIKLDNILNYDLEDLKLEKKIAKKINEFASQNVALKDKLTKAYNRYYLANIVKELLKDNTEFKLYMLDLNKFKPINDTYGHEAGDIVLVETANRLGSITEFRDSVFRVGGDEFVLIQSENLEKDLKKEISEKVNEPISYQDIDLEISTSIGLAQSVDHSDLKKMLAVADESMFKDKGNKGR